MTYFGWSDDGVSADSTREDFSAGRIPLVNWEPFDVDFGDIVGGRYDELFDWETFGEVFEPLYRRLETLGKPVMIGETASDEVGGSKADWIADVVPQLQSRFTAIRALVWFDVDEERHWQVRSSASSLQAFRDMAANPYLRS